MIQTPQEPEAPHLRGPMGGLSKAQPCWPPSPVQQEAWDWPQEAETRPEVPQSKCQTVMSVSCLK